MMRTMSNRSKSIKADPKINPKINPRSKYFGKKFSNIGLLICLFILAIACSLFWNPNQGAWGQPDLPNLKWLMDRKASSVSNDVASIDNAPVKLDGYQLFVLTTPSVNQKFPLEQRVKGIEEELNRIANSNFEPEKLKVTAELDELSDQPVISVNGRYLMTVTDLDAQMQGRDPQGWANQLTQIIRDALTRANQERQPTFLRDRSLISIGIVFLVILIQRMLSLWQKRLKSRQKVFQSLIEAKIDAQPDPVAIEASQQELLIEELSLKQKVSLRELQQRILQIAQLVVIGGGCFVIFGLFPYTRWLQFFIFSEPLQILGILLGTYVLIRVSNILVERFSGILQAKDFKLLQSSQRLELRVSTISKVLKNSIAIVLVSLAILLVLSVIGVDLIPLLAGAGIIGLAISFAAQGLIKDIINGFLIILEDQYAVGDVIVVGALGGFVENMNLRITQIRNNEGQLITIPNSAIEIVQNLSKDWARVDLTIEVSYDNDPDRVLSVLQKLSQEIYSESPWRNKILELPEVLGIDDLQHSGMLIRIWIKTAPLQQWAIAREFRRRLKIVMQQQEIEIGIPRQSLRFNNPLDLTGN